MNKWYKFLTEAVENKKSLNEISKNQLEKTRMYDFLEQYPLNQFDKLFDGKNRFTIPIESGEEVIAQKSHRDQQMLQYINDLRKDGWTIDFSEPFGYASKIITSEYGGKTFQNKRKMKIGPLISALGDTAKEFWEKNNKFYTTKENEFYFATKYMIVISRAPIDILRMSDHDGWTSCHSTGGGYFKCAIEESVTGGAVSYIVKEKDLEGIDAVVIDKTGTLTTGMMTVFERVGEAAVVEMAAAVEAGSEHPLARAILRAAQASGITVPPAKEFLAVPGKGVSAVVAGERIWVGTREWMHSTEI
jgi:hypothetical protein